MVWKIHMKNSYVNTHEKYDMKNTVWKIQYVWEVKYEKYCMKNKVWKIRYEKYGVKNTARKIHMKNAYKKYMKNTYEIHMKYILWFEDYE